MFTWICPKCGREVGPSYSECPFCAELAAAKPAAPAQPPVAVPPPPQAQYPPQPQYTPAPAPPPPPPPPAAQPVYYVGAEDHKRSIPGWLAAVLAFAAVALVVFAVIYFMRGNRPDASPAAAKAALAEKQKAAGNPYGKFLELTGFRITEAPGKKLQVQFLAVNHGAADLSGIEGIITLQIKGDPNAEPACTFKFQIENIPSYGAKEIEVKTFIQKRKFFDMPDWLFINPVVEFTSSE